MRFSSSKFTSNGYPSSYKLRHTYPYIRQIETCMGWVYIPTHHEKKSSKGSLLWKINKIYFLENL